jgi:competence protein ComEC
VQSEKVNVHRDGMIKTAIAMVLGSVIVFYGNLIPESHWIAYFPALLLCAFFIPRYRFLIIFFTTCLWTGFAVQQSLDTRLSADFDNRIFLVSGVIADIPEQRSESVRFFLKPDFIEGYTKSLPETIRLSWYRTRRVLNAGERWQLLVKLRVPSGFQNPGGFDYERWLFVNRVGATGYVRSSPDNQLTGISKLSFVNRWRSEIQRGIDRQCSECDRKGLIKALAIGYRADIDPLDRKLLQDSGTAHLLAISGLHIGIISALFFYLGRWLWRLYFHRSGIGRNQFCATLAVSAGLLYAALAGFSLPTVRALIMLAVIFFAFTFRTRINLSNSIAIAVIVILIFDPLSVGSSSFWLSISALLLIAFAQYLFTSQTQRWKQVVALQLLFSLLFVPISIILFEQINPASFFANIVAIPLVSLLIVPLGMLGSLFAGFDWFVAEWMFNASNWLLGLLLDYLALLLDSGLAAIKSASIPFITLCLSTAGLVILLMPAGFPAKKPALLAVLLPLFWQESGLEHGAYRLTVLDVGMGTSAVIQTSQHSLVYDFGPGNEQGYSSAQWVLLPYLRYQGIGDPDLLIISHVDQDHSGGFYSYLASYDPAKLVSGTPLEVRKKFALEKPVRSCHDYKKWRWDGVEFEFLSLPIDVSSKSINNRSCVLKVNGHDAALLTGDIEAGQELRLLREIPEQLPARILMVPHHGSRTSSTPAFLQAVKPAIALFPVGRNNRWGFPKAEVLENYHKLNSQILRTDQQGAITITSHARGLDLETHRKPGSKTWY